MTKTVSIIVPAYNAEAYIRTVVQSLFCLQGNDDYGIEVIVVDDASTDRTGTILESLHDHPSVQDGKVSYKVFSFSTNTPGGVACGANYGIEHASGEFVAFLDADDWIVPDQFLKAVEELDRGGYDFVLNRCWDYHVPSSERRVHGDQKKLEKIDIKTGMLCDLKAGLLRVSAVPWRKIYRRDFLNSKGLRFVEVDYAYEDNPFHWDVVLSAESIGFTTYHTHVYRIGHGSQSVSGGGVKFLRMFDHYDALVGVLEKHSKQKEYEPQLIAWLIDHTLWAGELLPRHAQPLLFERAGVLLGNHGLEKIVSELAQFSDSRWVIDRILATWHQDLQWFMQLK
ncbi:glycosyltransferase family 2 protein [Aquicoccus sp. SU-CL01552]|uniref:glycosyltransferase family 2 protein n=1 Tax=Aquicoccus sp. SU-CL01552 TaxID=3127656 RepID=UPI0031080122